MKIGVISDIHGNIEALKVVLGYFKKNKVDKILCLGDLIGGAPYSDDVVQLVKNNNIVCVLGNREKYLINGMPKVVHDEKYVVNNNQMDFHNWIVNELSIVSKNYIKSLPKDYVLDIDGKKIYLCHYPMLSNGSFKKHIKKATALENEIMFEDIDADIFLYGHTHEPVYNFINDKFYINPGALGCPGNSSCAVCGILEINHGDVSYKFIKLSYNVEDVVKNIEKVKFPGYEGVLKLFYGKSGKSGE